MLKQFSTKNNKKLISEQTLLCLFRAILEPVLENLAIKSKVMLCTKDKSVFNEIIEELKSSGVDLYLDKTFEGNTLSNYLFVTCGKILSLFIWNKSGDKYKYSYYINNDFVFDFAKKINPETFSANQTVEEDFTIETIKKLFEYIEDNDIAKNIDSENPDSENIPPDKYNEYDEYNEYDIRKIRYISHEIKNQLSICDLYAEIIIRYCNKNNIFDNTLLKSAECIKQSIQMAGNSLLELKSSGIVKFKKYNVNELISDTLELSKVYGVNKNIEFQTELKCKKNIYVDKHKFQSVIINLIKNACEAFEDEQESKNITIKTGEENGFVTINVSNNAKPIKDCEAIFNEGYTTKSTGSGFGLYICKKNIEELSGKLRLVKSDDQSTEFEIVML